MSFGRWNGKIHMLCSSAEVSSAGGNSGGNGELQWVSVFAQNGYGDF